MYLLYTNICIFLIKNKFPSLTQKILASDCNALFLSSVSIASVKLMDDYLKENGYTNDMNLSKLHHEIYLSDPRKTEPEKWKTVIRHPIKKA